MPTRMVPFLPARASPPCPAPPQALAAYKAAANHCPDNRQVAEKVRHVSKLLARKAKPAEAQAPEQQQQHGEQQ